jgi:hypothetical protein
MTEENGSERSPARIGFAERLRNIGTYIKFLLLIGVLAGGYFAYNKVSDIIGDVKDTVTGIIPEVGKPLVCPASMVQRGLLCYDACPEGWPSDGTNSCYQPCPAGWPGTETLTHCQHKAIYSTVGADASKSIPKGCPSGQVAHAGLCYDVPQGWHVTAPGFIGKECPSGWRDDGTTCWKDIHTYGRGAGYPIWDEAKCKTENSGGCEKSGAIWYPVCKTGYVARGCCLCERPPQTMSKSVKSQIGKLPSSCSGGRVLVGRLCYPACETGYERRGDNVEYCSSKCPSGFTNIGIGGCQKPSKRVAGQGLTIVGVCPEATPVRKGELCYRAES